jgi:lysophospholipid acyltransferase (LPLAT)-like uncharacterized protein
MGLPVFKQWGSDALIALASRILKIWFGTCRIRILNEDLYKEFFLGDRQFIGVSWHRSSIFGCYYYGPFHPLVMFSPSRDGEYLTTFAQKCGIIPVRASSKKGGEKGLIHMIRALKAGNRMCATNVDGPQGPRFKAKRGFLLLAKKTGVPLLPYMWSARNPITLEKSWDRTMIPRPFSQVVVTYGPPLYIPEDCNDLEMEAFQQELEKRINTIMIEVDQACGYKTRWE